MSKLTYIVVETPALGLPGRSGCVEAYTLQEALLRAQEGFLQAGSVLTIEDEDDMLVAYLEDGHWQFVPFVPRYLYH